MPRITKCRKICAEYEQKLFTPDINTANYVTLNYEELEALRLCDYEAFDQDKAAEAMQVSRGTFQRILYSARRKSASALCEGYAIKIEGGNYEIKSSDYACNRGCHRCKMK